jgi:hypothetical protein
MDPLSIVTYLSTKDTNAREIYADMNETLGADCIGYSTVTKYLRKKVSRSRHLTQFLARNGRRKFIDEAILGALEECLLSSLSHITKRILIPMSTVRYHLVNSSGNRIRNIRWVPHSPSSSQKQARVEMSQDLFQVLRFAKRHDWKYIVILAEAWFYFSNHFDRI